MMAPTGSWRGAAAVRATRSAAANKVPPASAAAGTTTRCAAVPKASRTRCGYHQANETDGAALYHGAGRHQAGEHDDDDAPAGEVQAEALGGGFTGGEHVERACDERHGDGG